MGKGFSRYATNATKTISISFTLQGKSGPILIILSHKDEIIFCMNVNEISSFQEGGGCRARGNVVFGPLLPRSLAQPEVDDPTKTT